MKPSYRLLFFVLLALASFLPGAWASSLELAVAMEGGQWRQSPAMRAALRQNFSTFLWNLPRGSRVSIIHGQGDWKGVIPFTPLSSLSPKRMDTILDFSLGVPVSDRTSNALEQAMRVHRQEAQAGAAKSVVLLTEGQGNPTAWQRMGQEAGELGVSLYVIDMSQTGEASLRDLGEGSGGRYFRTGNPVGVENALAQIAKHIRDKVQQPSYSPMPPLVARQPVTAPAPTVLAQASAPVMMPPVVAVEASAPPVVTVEASAPVVEPAAPVVAVEASAPVVAVEASTPPVVEAPAAVNTPPQEEMKTVHMPVVVGGAVDQAPRYETAYAYDRSWSTLVWVAVGLVVFSLAAVYWHMRRRPQAAAPAPVLEEDADATQARALPADLVPAPRRATAQASIVPLTVKEIIQNTGNPPRAALIDLNRATGRVSHPILRQATVIGRKGNTLPDDPRMGAIHIDGNTVSRRHALLEYKNLAFWLRDLGSYNGTRVNGVPLKEPVRLRHGDVVEIDEFRFGFALMDEKARRAETIVGKPPALGPESKQA